MNWGLGSSSSLIYNIAQWAYISPFELAFNTLKESSGYDIACAQSTGPILYQKKSLVPKWWPVTFNPPFKENLYFIHQGVKRSTQEAIGDYRQAPRASFALVEQISELTKAILSVEDLSGFNQIIREHECLVGEHLGLIPLKEQRFADYWGEVKSLGAWGGDFALVTSQRSFEDTFEYFKSKGIETFLKFDDLILKNSRIDFGQKDKNLVH